MTDTKGFGLLDDALKLFLQFLWASDAVKSRVVEFLTGYGLTLSQFGVLDAVYHLGPRPQKDLGKSIFKSGGNITKVVDNLEKKALVKRVKDEEDRRFYLIHLTQKGRKLIEKVLPLLNETIKKEMSRLNRNEREDLSRLCVKLGVAEEGAAS